MSRTAQRVYLVINGIGVAAFVMLAVDAVADHDWWFLAVLLAFIVAFGVMEVAALSDYIKGIE